MATSLTAPSPAPRSDSPGDRYKWVALSNVTLAVLLATLDASITIIAIFPHLISGPFHSGLGEAFLFAVIACLIGAVASLMRGGAYRG